jgi:hypothetical protein
MPWYKKLQEAEVNMEDISIAKAAFRISEQTLC